MAVWLRKRALGQITPEAAIPMTVPEVEVPQPPPEVPCPMCGAPVVISSYRTIPSHVAPEHEAVYRDNAARSVYSRMHVPYCDAGTRYLEDAEAIVRDRAEGKRPGVYQRPHP